MNSKNVCIVVPVYNEADGLFDLIERLDAVSIRIQDNYCIKTDYVFVDDGSDDSSFKLLSEHDFGVRSVRILRFSRNFGKEAALSAGIEAAQYADAAVLMDADLQHPPEMIYDFVRIWLNENADSVYAYKANRPSEGFLKNTLSRSFFWLMNRGQRYEIRPGAGDFRIINKRFMNALGNLPERDRFMKGLYGWVGLNQVGLALEPPPRCKGASKFNTIELSLLTLDAITSFTTVPLRLMALAGFMIAAISAAYGFYVVMQHLFFPAVPVGIASILALIAFFGGAQMVFLGILGEYVGKSIQEAKKRPSYVLADDIIRKEPASAHRG